MAIALRRTPTLSFAFFKLFIQFSFVSIIRIRLGTTIAIGIGAQRYHSPAHHRRATQSSFAAESPSSNCSFNQHRRRRICGERSSMLRIGNRLIRHATGNSNQPVSSAFSSLSSNSLSSGMTSRKRPVPGAASFTTSSCSNSPPSVGRRKVTTAPQQQVNDNNREEPTQRDGEAKRQSYRPLVIVLAGPTAVGKSDVAAELCSPALSSDISQEHFRAQHSYVDDFDSGSAPRPPMAVSPTTCFRGHVISADSVQAYRGVDIGANKPTLNEMERTPHHLVDVVDPPTDPLKAASYNAADWTRDAEYVVRELTSHAVDNGDDASDGAGGETGEGSVDHVALVRRESIEKSLRRSLDASNDNNDDTATLGKPPVLPVVVGGTMMYLQWLVHGRPDAVRPTAEAVERATNEINDFRREVESITMESKASGSATESSDEKKSISEDDALEDAAAWNAAAAHVSSLGPVFARRVDKLPGRRDWYRLRRLLEVAYTMASKKREAAEKDTLVEQEILRCLTEKEVYTGVRSGSLPDLGYDVRCFFLCPDERMAHFHVVDERCERMLLRGLLRETADLAVRGGLPEGSQLARAIGYRQSMEYLHRANAKRDDSKAFAAFVDDFATATRQYAKKQMQWFRRDARFAFVPVRIGREKATRAADAAGTIAGMCKLSPAEFEAELSATSAKNDGVLPLSAQTKLDNERQGKKMKFFMSKRARLVNGSEDFLSVLAEADECTRKVQGLGEEF